MHYDKLETIFGVFGVPYPEKKFNDVIDFANLTLDEQYVMSSIFYPFTRINEEQIRYIEYFWSKKDIEFSNYIKVIKYMKSKIFNEAMQNEMTYDLKVSVAHFYNIDRIHVIAELVDGLVLIREVILPEQYITDGSIIALGNELERLPELIKNFDRIVLTVPEPGELQPLNSNKVTMVITDKSIKSDSLILKGGFQMGRYDISGNRLMIYSQQRLLMVYGSLKTTREVFIKDLTDSIEYCNEIYTQLQYFDFVNDVEQYPTLDDFLTNLVMASENNTYEPNKISLQKY